MPADTLQLYHPMTLQSMPNTPGGHHHGPADYMPARHMLGPPSSRSTHHLGPASNLDFSQNRHMGLYVPGQTPHSAGPGHSHYMSSEVPLSAPPSLSNNPFSSHHSSHHPSHGQNMYPSFNGSSRAPLPEHQAQSSYFNDGHSHSGSAPGSGYATPQ